MSDRLAELAEAVSRWRAQGIDDYWLSVSYIGSAINRFGDHDLTFVEGTFWHLWDGRWRAIEKGSDFWLFSVPGAFAWARDLLTRTLPALPGGVEMFELDFDEKYGYVKLMRLRAAGRDRHNLTFEVRRFGEGPFPGFVRQELDG